MKLFGILRRFILIALLLLFGQLTVATIIHDRGITIAALNNLPHRSLGMLWTAHLMLPAREDFAADYLGQWLLLDREQFLLEGQRYPVVPVYSCHVASQFPRDKRIQRLSKLMKDDYRPDENPQPKTKK